ncbi:hypothetical protein N9M03_00050 [bacterium]|nr:hypothetical protein [bacterium]
MDENFELFVENVMTTYEIALAEKDANAKDRVSITQSLIARLQNLISSDSDASQSE